ncbi:hypothetical protein ACJJTC_018581 [Scirpophaga incertulas]
MTLWTYDRPFGPTPARKQKNISAAPEEVHRFSPPPTERVHVHRVFKPNATFTRAAFNSTFNVHIHIHERVHGTPEPVNAPRERERECRESGKCRFCGKVQRMNVQAPGDCFTRARAVSPVLQTLLIFQEIT